MHFGLKDRHLLVTGGAGFIGSELVRRAAASGAIITIVDNLVNGKRENVADVLSDRIALEVRDIRDEEAMLTLLEDVDMVFHLACLGVRHSLHSPLENHEVNATASLGLLRTSMQQGVSRFVYVSTSEVYGCLHPAPPMPETYPAFPATVYGASKLAGECYARAMYRSHGFPTVVVRPFNTYGPRCHHEGDSGEVIPKFMLRCMAGQPMIIFDDGTQSRDFTYVSDTASGIIETGLAPGTVGMTINIGSGRHIAIRDLAQEVADVVGNHDAPVEYHDPRPGDVFHLCADTTRARQLFGFEPRVALREGLTMLRDWYMSLDVSPGKLLEQEHVRNWEFVGAGR